jgi:hypothetical protein
MHGVNILACELEQHEQDGDERTIDAHHEDQHVD